MAVHYRTCPFCEATCGLRVETEGEDVVSIRGDEQDVLSHGFICPKAYGLKELHEDPDRLTTPLIRRNGELVEASWEEGFEEIDRRLTPILEEHGRNSTAVYLGNPNAHNLSAMTYGPVWLRALGSQNVYSASTVDQMPKQVAAGLMFGTILSIPVPDVDRTDHLLILGANPLVSNGSLLTAPDMRGRIRGIRERGGKVVVIDPRRSRTAEEADEHHFIRPGTDAHLLLGIASTLVEEGLEDTGDLAEHLNGLDEVRELVRGFPPERVAATCGIDADEIRRMARELAGAERAAGYARIGTTTQELGTLASWLVDVVNVLTGNLDREGGAMFTLAAAAQKNSTGEAGQGKGVRLGRWHSRVRGLPEAYGELPVACLAEQIDTPGDGQVRALITVAGNPVVSTPNSDRLAAALDELDFMVSIDIYVNETTRHADVILPSPSPLEKAHFDFVFQGFAIRNYTNYSPPVLPRPDGMPDEWETVLRLVGVATGQGSDADVAAIDDFVVRAAIGKEAGDPYSPWHGRDVEEALADLAPRTGTARLIDMMLRTGPYHLTLAEVEAQPHGIDLGPLQPRLPEVLRTPSGRIELAPPALVADVARLHEALGAPPADLVLIGRRHLRSNNSWMHNLPLLVRGPEQCTLHVHPDDAARLALVDGGRATIRSRVGTIEAPVEVTPDIRPGVVSLPHGWGHDRDGADMAVARAHAGVNTNVLTDEAALEPLTGTAVPNGIPVEVLPAAVPAEPVAAAG